MAKFLVKLTGWSVMAIIEAVLAVAAVGAILHALAFAVVAIVPTAIGLFIVGSVLYVVFNVLFGKD